MRLLYNRGENTFQCLQNGSRNINVSGAEMCCNNRVRQHPNMEQCYFITQTQETQTCHVKSYINVMKSIEYLFYLCLIIVVKNLNSNH